MLRSTTTSPHDLRYLPRDMATFREWRGQMDYMIRSAEIAALPRVVWRGRTLYTLRCNGTTGKGPHDVNVPERLLWNLIELRAFVCPYHA